MMEKWGGLWIIPRKGEGSWSSTNLGPSLYGVDSQYGQSYPLSKDRLPVDDLGRRLDPVLQS